MIHEEFVSKQNSVVPWYASVQVDTDRRKFRTIRKVRIRGGGGENKMKIPRFSKRRESKAGTCVRSMRLDTHPSRLTRGRVKVKQGRTPRKGLAET